MPSNKDLNTIKKLNKRLELLYRKFPSSSAVTKAINALNREISSEFLLVRDGNIYLKSGKSVVSGISKSLKDLEKKIETETMYRERLKRNVKRRKKSGYVFGEETMKQRKKKTAKKRTEKEIDDFDFYEEVAKDVATNRLYEILNEKLAEMYEKEMELGYRFDARKKISEFLREKNPLGAIEEIDKVLKEDEPLEWETSFLEGL